MVHYVMCECDVNVINYIDDFLGIRHAKGHMQIF